MKKFIFITILIVGAVLGDKATAQLTGIAINDNGAKADTSAILDVNVNTASPKRGFLLPRMTTTQRNAIYQPAKGLMIYVTDVDSLEINLGTAASPVWGALATSATATGWLTTGNSGTNSGYNFLGTTDNKSLSIRTNSIERIFVDSLGHVGIGSSIFDPNNPGRLLVAYGNTTSNTIANFTGSIDSYLQINVKNTNTGVNSSSDIVATADIGTDTTNYIDMGINGSNYASGPDYWGGSLDAYLYSYSKNLLIGTQKASTDIIFLMGGGSIKNNAALRIAAPSGNIVIGKGENTNNPIGNILRGPSASSGSPNISGGHLTIQGGGASGTGAGGNINIYGGTTVSGTTGSVNINTSLNSATNINTGTSASDVTIGGSSNNILFPKFTTVGGIIYTTANTGQIGGTTQLIWDNANTRLGVGTASPLYTLHVNAASDPLFLNGVQTGAGTDSVLTIMNGVVKKITPATLSGSGTYWSLTGNAASSTNFLGTTNTNPLVFKVNSVQAGYIGNSSNANVALGYNASLSTNQQNISIGALSGSTGNNSTAVGYSATAAFQSIGLGSNSTASGNNSVALGYGAGSTAFQSTAVGYNTNATGNNSVALGYNAQATVNQSTALGNNASATTAQNTTAVGNAAVATGLNSTALGSQASTSGQNSVALGNGASATTINSMALGNGASATANNTVRIGNNAVGSIGGFANWTNVSDGRVKKNIRSNVPGLDFINKLKPVTYNLDLDAADRIVPKPPVRDKDGKIIQNSPEELTARKEKEKIIYSGFIAQDVEKAAKELNYDFSGVDVPNNNGLYGLRYSDFVVPLVKATQELNQKNEELNKKNEELNKKLDDQQKAINALIKEVNELKKKIN